MLKKVKEYLNLFKEAGINWNKNDPWPRSAAIAYYALFSLPSLLIIVVTVAGYFFGEEAVRGEIAKQAGEFIGTEAAMAIEAMIKNVSLAEESTWAVVLSIAMLIFAATGVFFQLKLAMNNIWNVTAKKQNFVRLLIDRLISFGMVMVLGLLLLISLIISAFLSILGDHIEKISETLTTVTLDVLNFSISFIIISTLFAALFKWLPDVKIRWKTTYLGAIMTTVLFLIGEFGIGYYFSQMNPASVYGGASAIVLILLWVNYICLIVFYGAEFTVQYALHKNETMEPTKYAESAIYQEIEKLKDKHVAHAEEEKILEKLRSSLHIDEDKLKKSKDNKE